MVFAPQEKWPKLHVVHCGVDPRQFTPTRHEGKGRRLLFVGRLAAVKGLPILLDALALLKQMQNRDSPGLFGASSVVTPENRDSPGFGADVVLTVAGDGPDRAKLEGQARELGLGANVRFVGYQSQAQVRQLLGETDIFVMSSFAEGVPVVLMEAMAAGVPVVATRIAGVPELVEDGISGYLVPPGDAQTLVQRVSALLDDAALRQRFGAAGRAQVEAEFNLANESRRLVQILTGALEGRTAPVRPDVEARTVENPSQQLAPALP
ncbi:MAG: glycosyl transferase group 1, partial [Phycisphaerales bacterium]|nr:glycosyl transferase group 1 [Phycisphaerales bacterium]